MYVYTLNVLHHIVLLISVCLKRLSFANAAHLWSKQLITVLDCLFELLAMTFRVMMTMPKGHAQPILNDKCKQNSLLYE